MSAVGTAKPDLIVLDLMMPRMDGLAFLGVLRSYLGWQHVPVVLMTAYSESVKAADTARLGVRDVLAKGQLPLVEVRRRIEAALADPGTSPADQPGTQPGIGTGRAGG